MKMKKTQSLKLMLLGLFALVSTGAWAQTYTAKDGVVYAEYAAYAEVVGVIESALPAWDTDGKQITIPDEVDGLKVTAFASGWTEAGWYQNGGEQALPNPTGYQAVTDPETGITTYTNTQSGGSVSYTGYQTTAAADIEAPIYMLIRASQITSITCDDVKNFQIKTFCLGKTSGITVIPENLFAMTTKVRIENPENAANQQAIADAQAIIDGYDEYYITDGQYEGKQVYVRSNGAYYIVDGDIVEKKNGEFCNPVYRLDYNAKNQTVSVTETGNWVKVDGDDLLLYRSSGWSTVASVFDGDAYPKTITGKQAIYDAAAADEAAKKQAYEDAVADYEQAVADKVLPNHEFSEEQLAKKAAAEKLKAAIEAFENDAKFAALQAKIKAEISNVNEVTGWFAAYATATGLVTVKSYWNTLIENFKKAYQDFYGTDPEAIENVKVEGYEVAGFTLDGALINSGTYTGDAAVALDDYVSAIAIDGSSDNDDENITAKRNGYVRIKLLQSGTTTYTFYVKVNPANQQEGEYYLAYNYSDRNGFSPVLYGDNKYLVFQFGDGKDYVYVPITGTETTIDAADPENDINAAIADATPKTAEELQAAVDAAKAAMDAAEDAWEAAQAATTAAKNDLDAAKNAVAAAQQYYEDNYYVNDYLYNKDLENTVLENVNLYNGIITAIEDHAFANCVNAKFKFGNPALGETDKFPATLETIGEEAFLNTLFANADFSQAVSEDLYVAEDAFAGTPLQILKLEGTTSENITSALVKTIVASIAKADENLVIEFCNDTKTLAAGEYNTTLTTVTLPVR